MKVSIVIPIYKVAPDYFRECITSVLTQSYKDIEVIVVDDGADDVLCEIADSFAKADERVRIVHQKNAGASAARNAGIANSTGDLLTFVDSDDYIHEDNISQAVARIKEDNLQVLLWGSYKCYPDRMEKYMPYTDDIRLFSSNQKKQLMLKTMVGWLPTYEAPASHYGSGSCCSKMYRLDFIRSNNLYYPEGIKRAEDVNFNIRVFARAERIGYLNKHFYYYRQLANSATYQYRENGISIFTDALMCLREFLDGYTDDEDFYQAYYMRCMFFFLESMDMDYLNAANKDSWGVRLSKMKKAASGVPYEEAIKRLNPRGLSMAKRVPYYLIKYKMMALLCIFYGLYKRIS